MAHPGGRPRTAIPERDELIELGKDLVKWSEQQFQSAKDAPTRWCEWYTDRGFVRKQWEHMREKEEFQWYYEKALANISKRYSDGTINSSIAHRYLRVYDHEVRDRENQDKEDDLKREQALQQGVAKDYEDKLMTIANQLQRAREAFSNKKATEDPS